MTKEMAERITCLLNNKSLAISVLNVFLFFTPTHKIQTGRIKAKVASLF